MVSQSKTKNLEKKLVSYSALAAGIFIAGNANGQIYYTDVDPDITLNMNDSASIDINSDGVADFGFKVGSIYSSGTAYGLKFKMDLDYVGIRPMNGAEVLNSYSYYSSYQYSSTPRLLKKDDIIQDVSNSSSSWGNDEAGLAAVGFYSIEGFGTGSIEEGNFIGAADKYVGLRFKDANSGTNWFYGWVRVDVNADATQIVIKDFAHEGVYNKGIAAGMATSGIITDSDLEKAEIYIANKNLVVNLNEFDIDGAVLRIVSLNGKELYKSEISDQKFEIDMDQYVPGAYIVNIYLNNGLIRKKVINQ